MRRNNIFWALLLIVAGALLLLDNMGVLAPLGISFWSLFWPLALIVLGIAMLWRITRPRPTFEAQAVSIPLEGAPRARVHLHHGAGRLSVRGGAGPGKLAEGTFRGGLEYRSRRDGDLLRVDMHHPSHGGTFFAPWEWGPGNTLDWDVALTADVPLAVVLETGADETHLDLTDLQVTDLQLKTGASATTVNLPAHAGQTRVKVESGVASVTLNVPGGVAARIRSTGALSSTHVDTTRFPRTAGGYESPDYATAAQRVEINVEVALGSVDIR